jgi:enoyl-CoA hydratase
VVITGEGDKAFIAGADIKEMQAMSKELAHAHSQLGQSIFSKIENFNKPVIAAINGYALGGGCELALACHMRYASNKALIGQPEVKLGLIAGFGGTQRLGKIVSKGKAMEILLSGKMYSSSESLSIGLVDGVFDHDELLDNVHKTINTISLNAPNAISKTIELVNKSYDLKLNDGLNIEAIEFGKLFNENESKEGMDAFIEKRKPNFE